MHTGNDKIVQVFDFNLVFEHWVSTDENALSLGLLLLCPLAIDYFRDAATITTLAGL
jgi:hypothetical protein